MSPVWMLPFACADGHVQASRRCIREAEKATKVEDRMRRRGAANANHRVVRAIELLIRAHDHLTGANDAFKAVLILYAMAPETLFPPLLSALSDRIVEGDREIAALTARLKDAGDELEELWANGVGPRPKVEPPSRPKPPRHRLVHRPANAADRIEALFKRRRRSKAAAPEDAPRGVSRGRAPPSLAVCSL
jgi:hypothetical protein